MTDFPTPSKFYDALTHTLGIFTNFCPGYEIHHERLFPPTLRRMGIDPEDTSFLVYPPKSQPHSRSLWRKFILAFRYMKDSPIRGESLTRVWQCKAKFYQLTTYGSQKALQIHEERTSWHGIKPARLPDPKQHRFILWLNEGDLYPAGTRVEYVELEIRNLMKKAGFSLKKHYLRASGDRELLYEPPPNVLEIMATALGTNPRGFRKGFRLPERYYNDSKILRRGFRFFLWALSRKLLSFDGAGELRKQLQTPENDLYRNDFGF